MKEVEKEWDRKLKDSVKETERRRAGQYCAPSATCCSVYQCVLGLYWCAGDVLCPTTVIFHSHWTCQ